MEKDLKEMKGRLLSTKLATYFVTQNEDGTINLYHSTEKIANAGFIINGFGGLEKVIERLGETVTMEEYLSLLEKIAEKKREERIQNIVTAVEKEKARAEERKRKFDELLSKSPNGIIETTAENVGIVLRYLNTSNWGGWNLPKMTISYSVNQYDCDGKTAATMILDKAIVIDDETGETAKKFKVDAPMGHLRKYHRI